MLPPLPDLSEYLPKNEMPSFGTGDPMAASTVAQAPQEKGNGLLSTIAGGAIRGLAAIQTGIEKIPGVKSVVEPLIRSNQERQDKFNTGYKNYVARGMGITDPEKIAKIPVVDVTGAVGDLKAIGGLEGMLGALAKETNPVNIQKTITPILVGAGKAPEEITAISHEIAGMSDQALIKDKLIKSVLPSIAESAPKAEGIVRGSSDPTLLTKAESVGADAVSVIPKAEPPSPETMSALIERYGSAIAKRIASLGGDELAQRAIVTGGHDAVKEALAINDGAVSASKLMDALKEAKAARAETDVMYAGERAARFGQAEQVAGEVGGMKGASQAMSALRGELPKADFEGVLKDFKQEDLDNLFNAITQNDQLSPGGKATARRALFKLLDPRGQIPQSSEIKTLARVFGDQFVESLTKELTGKQKIAQGISEVLNVPRALMASMDLSAPFRQGALLIATKPGIGLGNIGDMVRYFGSSKFYEGAMDSIMKDQLFNLSQEAGLSLTGTGGTALMANKEEAFMSNLAERIPGIGRLVSASDRAYAGYLNKTRFDIFKALAEEYILGGMSPQQNPEIFEGLAKFVNNASGRGDLGKWSQAAPALNSVFFSPRFVASRMQFLNPQFYMSLPQPVRIEAMKSFVKFVGAGIGALTLAKMGGAEVEANPLSSDFGKIKVGNIRYDVWAGFQPLIRYTAQLIMGQRKASSGDTIPANRRDTALRFIESKLAPVPSLVDDILRGSDIAGNPITFSSEAMNKFMPIYIQDLIDAAQQYGVGGVAAVAVPGIFGIGTQSYSKKIKYNAFGLPEEGGVGLPPLPDLSKFVTTGIPQ